MPGSRPVNTEDDGSHPQADLSQTESLDSEHRSGSDSSQKLGCSSGAPGGNNNRHSPNDGHSSGVDPGKTIKRSRNKDRQSILPSLADDSSAAHIFTTPVLAVSSPSRETVSEHGKSDCEVAAPLYRPNGQMLVERGFLGDVESQSSAGGALSSHSSSKQNMPPAYSLLTVDSAVSLDLPKKEPFSSSRTAIPQGHDLFKLTPAEKRSVYSHPDLNRLASYKGRCFKEQFRDALYRFYDPDGLHPLLGMDYSTFLDCCTIDSLNPRPLKEDNQDKGVTRSVAVTIVYPGEFRPKFVDGCNFFENYEPYDMSDNSFYERSELQLSTCLHNLLRRLQDFIEAFCMLSPHIKHITIVCWIPIEDWKEFISAAISWMEWAAKKATSEYLGWSVRLIPSPTLQEVAEGRRLPRERVIGTS